MTLSAGSRLGPYEVVGALGAGGMGEVYRAHDTRLGRDVAIKVLPQHAMQDADARQRFEREARAISSLNHPHVCTLYDVGHEGDTDFLVLELLEGDTLARRLEKGPLEISELLRVGIDIGDALDRARRGEPRESADARAQLARTVEATLKRVNARSVCGGIRRPLTYNEVRSARA